MSEPKLDLDVERLPLRLNADKGRVITRPFVIGGPSRVRAIFDRVASLTEEAASALLATARSDYGKRHHDVDGVFRQNVARAFAALAAPGEQSERPQLSEERRLLAGAYFTHEYSIEAAALFNPSVVPHPDQSGVPSGSMRFIMSLRACGEGHISSIEFRSGLIHVAASAAHRVTLDPITRFAATAGRVIEAPGDPASYEIEFGPETKLSERVIFPVSENESRGIEDARFVRFVPPEGRPVYYATYTAYDGVRIRPQLLETEDFRRFRVKTIGGRRAQNKGMALFPRKVGGQFVMVSRLDGENLFLQRSDELDVWNEAQLLYAPKYPWEFVQVGNCGSPIETERGWILLTHGVGPVRQYWMGALLLDLDDPSRVIGELAEPLLAPNAEEREGYVPNVVYSCGAMAHDGTLVIPYAVSDTATSVAAVSIASLLEKLVLNPPSRRARS